MRPIPKLPKQTLAWFTSLVACTALILSACTQETNKTAAVTTPPKRPHMWLDYKISQHEEKNFLRFADILKRDRNNTPETDSIFYDVQEFTGMIDSCGQIPHIAFLEVYYAVFGDEGTPYVPSGLGGKLTPLFIPIDSNGNELFYFLLPEGAISFSPTKYAIPKSIEKNWIANYQNTIVKWLNPFLDSKDPCNYPGHTTTNPGNLSNTTQVRYLYSEFPELENEITYQASAHGDVISGFRFFFGAMDSVPPAQFDVYSNRLLSQFEFTQDKTPGVHSAFYIDTTTGFSSRDTQPAVFAIPHPVNFRPALLTDFVHGELLGLDNGALCPPTCN